MTRVTRVPGDTGQGLPGYPEIQDKGYQGTRRKWIGLLEGTWSEKGYQCT